MTSRKKKGDIADPGNVLLILYVGCVLLFVVLAMAVDAGAAVPPSSPLPGELLFQARDKPGEYQRAPRLSQDAIIFISGMTARSRLSQQFVNNSGRWQEAVYVFPLPSGSVVDSLRMKIGTREINGEIREREEARLKYNKARAEGKKASLLDQQRPNIFTMAVANIAPSEKIEVEIEFSQIVSLVDNIFSLRFPMVVGPRYIPGNKAVSERLEFLTGEMGWAIGTDQVPDAGLITPPVNPDPSTQANPVTLTLELAPGFPVARLESLYHGIDVEERDNGVKHVRFNGEIRADRDFVLEWEAEQLMHPRAALFTESLGEDDFHLLMLTPPSLPSLSPPPARELIFILDTSGSMAGPSISQARSALTLAISRLTSRDRFNVIRFNSNADKLFERPVAGNDANKKLALKFVAGLDAEGGTEMASALRLGLDGRSDHDRLRQVVFLTDGSVGNESALFSLIKSRLGDSRLFTVGIGSAPNSFFMSRAAAVGRGTFVHIGKSSEIQAKMSALFRKLENPAITNITVASETGQDLEYYPKPVPDLYSGEVLVISARMKEQSGPFQVRGVVNGMSWQQTVGSMVSESRPGIRKLWAREKIKSIMASSALNDEEKRTDVLEVALAHALVSKFTSLVAVEDQVARPSDKELTASEVKVNLPAGWKAAAIFGGTARTGTAANLEIMIGFMLLLTAFLMHSGHRRRTA